MVTMVFDGRKLKFYRLKSGFSQTKLAARVGMSPRYIRNLERGDKDNPSAKLLKRICMVLNISPDMLLGVVGDEEQDLLSASSASWNNCKRRQQCTCRYAKTPTPCLMRGQDFVNETDSVE